jgi:hypothetical protein
MPDILRRRDSEAMLTRESRSLERCGLRQARLTRETRERLDEYVRRARAAGASWQTVGSALGITRQSAWERFRNLPGCAAKGTATSKLPRLPAQRSAIKQKLAVDTEKYVQRMRAEGASWQAVGSALGITRQSAWERFLSTCVYRKDQGIPDGVLQARYQQPHIFADWVINVAKTDKNIEQWLEIPDIDLGRMAGFGRAVPPIEPLGGTALRSFLMAAGHGDIAPTSSPDSANCTVCGRVFLNKSFLASHRKRDHGNLAPKPQPMK